MLANPIRRCFIRVDPSLERNESLPKKNSSPVYLEAAERIMQSMAAAGLPEG